MTTRPARARILPGLAAAAAVALVGGLLIWRQATREPRRPRDVTWPEPPIPAALMTYRPVAGPTRAYPGGARAWGLALGPDGSLVVCGTKGLAVFPPGATTPRILVPELAVRAVVVRGDGGYLCCAGDRVVVLDAAGRRLDSWDVAAGGRLDAIAIDAGGILIADGGRRVVWRLDAAGRPLARWGDEAGEGRFKVPGDWFDLAVLDDGTVAVANPGRHRVQLYDPTGAWRGAFGRVSATDLAGFTGCCNPVALAGRPGGDVVVTEKGLSRVKVMDRSGRVVAVVAGYDAFPHAGELRPFAIDVAVDAAGRVHLLENQDYRVLVYESIGPATDMSTVDQGGTLPADDEG